MSSTALYLRRLPWYRSGGKAPRSAACFPLLPALCPPALAAAGWQRCRRLLLVLSLACSLPAAVYLPAKYAAAAKAAAGTAPPPADKRALIIAVGQYAANTGWSATHATHDVPLMKAALARQGFDTLRRVRVLRDAEADKAGMLAAFRELIGQAAPGSAVVIHFSGHGQQLQDRNGDELDGYDEALVPYDAPHNPPESYRGEKHLLDDELEGLLLELRRKVGPGGHVLLVVDACHSGTATRGDLPARGTHLRIGTASPAAAPQPAQQDRWMHPPEEEKLAPWVMISGSGAQEINYETRNAQGQLVGSLTYALSRALTEADPLTTYRGLFDQVRQRMYALAPFQTPQLEGDADRQLLGGQAVRSRSYYLVEDVVGPQLVKVSGGTLTGLFPGSRLAFYEIDVRDTTQGPPKARGKVVRSSLSSCDVRLDQPLDEQAVRNSWVFVEQQAFGQLRVYCQIDPDLPEVMLRVSSRPSAGHPTFRSRKRRLTYCSATMPRPGRCSFTRGMDNACTMQRWKGKRPPSARQ